MWSYDPTNLENSLKDQVRLALGDTDIDSPLLQDEEIEFLLKTNGNDIQATTLAGCSSIIAMLSQEVNFKVGPYSESQDNRLKAFQTLYTQLLTQAGRLSPPLMKSPTTTPIFNYDMLSYGKEDHEL